MEGKGSRDSKGKGGEETKVDSDLLLEQGHRVAKAGPKRKSQYRNLITFKT